MPLLATSLVWIVSTDPAVELLGKVDQIDRLVTFLERPIQHPAKNSGISIVKTVIARKRRARNAGSQVGYRQADNAPNVLLLSVMRYECNCHKPSIEGSIDGPTNPTAVANRSDLFFWD